MPRRGFDEIALNDTIMYLEFELTLTLNPTTAINIDFFEDARKHLKSLAKLFKL